MGTPNPPPRCPQHHKWVEGGGLGPYTLKMRVRSQGLEGVGWGRAEQGGERLLLRPERLRHQNGLSRSL